MKIENFGKLNKLYNFQDTIIFCEIFEQHILLTFKKCLNLILNNVILPVLFVAVYMEIKVSV